MNAKSRSRLVAVPLIAALALIGGCTGGGDGAEQTPPPVVTTHDPVPPGAPVEIPTTAAYDVRQQPGTLDDGYVGALADVALVSCDSADGATHAAGTVTNPEASAQTYRIYVAVMVGVDTLGLSQVDVPSVAVGATSEWTADLQVGADGAQCVLRVERVAG